MPYSLRASDGSTLLKAQIQHGFSSMLNPYPAAALPKAAASLFL